MTSFMEFMYKLKLPKRLLLSHLSGRGHMALYNTMLPLVAISGTLSKAQMCDCGAPGGKNMNYIAAKSVDTKMFGLIKNYEAMVT